MEEDLKQAGCFLILSFDTDRDYYRMVWCSGLAQAVREIKKWRAHAGLQGMAVVTVDKIIVNPELNEIVLDVERMWEHADEGVNRILHEVKDDKADDS